VTSCLLVSILLVTIADLKSQRRRRFQLTTAFGTALAETAA